jgi:glycosyltransferase involved in cell wall biosynthesis
MWPQIGGHPKYLDVLGINYYHNNQWIHNGPPIDRFHPLYRPFSQLVREVYERYERPLFIAETGIEDEARPNWLRYIGDEVATVIAAGVPMEGICLYPIFCHPGWDNDRYCHNGLWEYADETGQRALYEPLARELRRQQKLIPALFAARQQKVEAQFKRLATTTSRKRVCLFTDSLEPSGMGEHMLLLAAQLKDRYDLSFVCPPNDPGKRFLQRAAELGIATLPLAVRGEDRTAWEQFRDFLEQEQIDLLHLHAGIGWEGHHGVYAADAANVPVILRTEHLPYLLTDLQEQQEYRNMVERVDHLITVSKVARISYLDQGLEACKVTAIANGIRALPLVPTYERAALRTSLAIPQEARVIVTVGRLTEQKAHRDLLAAIPEIVRYIPKTRFLWIGDGPLKGELGKEIRAQRLGRRVQMLGTRSDVALFLQAADLLVMPSLFEGMPIVLLEAMSVGLPIVATNVGGNAELIEDGRHGWLVPPSNPPALAGAVVEALENPALTSMRSAAAQKRFQQAFTVDQMADRVDELYQRLIHQAHPRRETVAINPLQIRIPDHEPELAPDHSTNGHVAEPLFVAPR